jgi:hypothetical protein
MPPIAVPGTEDFVMSDTLDPSEPHILEEHTVGNNDNDPRPRLVINQIVTENFKSYAGRQIIGPFHKVAKIFIIYSSKL